MNRYRTLLIAVGIFIVILVAVIFVFGLKRTDDRFTGEIKFWGLESPDVWKDLIAAFEAEYKGLRIIYEQKNLGSYETDLINAMAAGESPDIFEMHHTWLIKHRDKMSSAIPELIDANTFRSEFVDAAAKDLIVQDTIIGGVPLYMDTLALYYNKDIFNAHSVINPPKTWAEFNNVVKQTTILGTDGAILQSGAALGTQNNIKHADDILEMFMLQNGAQLADSSEKKATFANERSTQEGTTFSAGQNALSYYTNFADPSRDVYTWSRRQGDALDFFTQGKSAMYVGYAADLSSVKASGINFDVVALPQITNRNLNPSYIDKNLARYWAGAVSYASPKKEASWTFLVFATSRNGQFNYLTKTQLPSARRDLIEVQGEQDPQLGVFAKQSLIADRWPQPDYEQVAIIFKDMIDAVNLGQASVQEAVVEGQKKVTELYNK